MVLVRIVLQCKWGTAAEVAQDMSESARTMAEDFGAREFRVLTDLSGPFHRVEEEIVVESLGEWEAARAKIFAHPEFAKSQERVAGMVESGHLEFFTIEYSR